MSTKQLRVPRGVDLGQYPYGHWITYKAARAVLEQMLTRPRPWHPYGPSVVLPQSGRSVRPCFGRTGYGDGMHGTGTCARWSCPDSDDCFRQMRQIIEATDSRMPEFTQRHAQLRRELVEGGMDVAAAGNAAMQQLAGGPHPRPLEEAMLANAELGFIDSGAAARCEGCGRVLRKSVLADGVCPRCVRERGAS